MSESSDKIVGSIDRVTAVDMCTVNTSQVCPPRCVDLLVCCVKSKLSSMSLTLTLVDGALVFCVKSKLTGMSLKITVADGSLVFCVKSKLTGMSLKRSLLLMLCRRQDAR